MKTTGVKDVPKFGLLDFLGHPNGQDFVTGTKKCLTNSQCELMVAEKNATSASDMFTKVLDYTSTVHAEFDA